MHAHRLSKSALVKARLRRHDKDDATRASNLQVLTLESTANEKREDP
jgi:hypothetical protein